MKTAALYARGSSDQQREDTTMASQRAALQEFAAAPGLAVAAHWVFEDGGSSGASLVRPGREPIRDLAAAHEEPGPRGWHPESLDPAFADELLAEIVGMDLGITRLEGKFNPEMPLAELKQLIEELKAKPPVAPAAEGEATAETAVAPEGLAPADAAPVTPMITDADLEEPKA